MGNSVATSERYQCPTEVRSNLAPVKHDQGRIDHGGQSRPHFVDQDANVAG